MSDTPPPDPFHRWPFTRDQDGGKPCVTRRVSGPPGREADNTPPPRVQSQAPHGGTHEGRRRVQRRPRRRSSPTSVNRCPCLCWGDVVNEVSKLKQKLDGEIVVYTSRQLVHTLMEHDLVDELRLMVYPVVLGAGERLIGEASDKTPVRPVYARTVGDSLVYLTYEVVRDA
jgi:RibD C-terminal domain